MYTRGLRKILIANHKTNTIDKCKTAADTAGYEVIAFNSVIFVLDKVSHTWIETTLALADFKIN